MSEYERKHNADVWYEGHEAGELLERERIIKLLEEQDPELWLGTNIQVIALIKGEEA